MVQTENFEALYQNSLAQEKEIKAGNIVSGKVIKITRDFILIDIGYKSEGKVSLSEFLDHEGQITVKEGEKVDVFLESTEDDEGLIIVSKEKADKLRIWDEIAQACENSEIVEGRVLDRVKGGLSVDIGVKAFLPGSQIDLTPVRDLERLVGQTFQFKIVKFNKIRGNIVLSRRAILEKQRESMRQETLQNIQEGSIVSGTVKNITDYGAFIDLGGLDGLLHITDLSWKRINHPGEILKVGQELKVKVLKFDNEKQRVSLGLKQMHDDPWKSADMRYPKNVRVKGKVVNLTEYGAFIEIEEGVEGLIHVSEMSWTKRVKHPSAILKLGEEVETVVLDIDIENRRMSLGLKQTQPNPWDELVRKYAPGTKVKGPVRNVTDFGVFVEVEEGIDGLVHVSDISWSNKVKNPHDVFKKGQEIETVVLNVDPAAERFALGIKQLGDDPWLSIHDHHPIGSEVEGKIVKITDFGLFVEVTSDVEGLVHISETSDENEPKLDGFNVGDSIKALVMDLDGQERKMSLSIRAFKQGKGKELAKQAAKKQKEVSKPTLGDIMGEELKSIGKKETQKTDAQ